MFLNRMRGIVRLYAAIIQTLPLPVGPSRPHPHGLEHGWAWLARVLNMEPHPTLTATAIGDFLEVKNHSYRAFPLSYLDSLWSCFSLTQTAGHALLRKYNKVFKKLLFVLCKEYVPK